MFMEATPNAVCDMEAKPNALLVQDGGDHGDASHGGVPRSYRTMDQLEELRGCDKRLTAGMLDRLGDLRR